MTWNALEIIAMVTVSFFWFPVFIWGACLPFAWIFGRIGNLFTAFGREGWLEETWSDIVEWAEKLFVEFPKSFYVDIYKKKPVLTIIAALIVFAGMMSGSPLINEYLGTTDITRRPVGTYCYYVQVDDYILPGRVSNGGSLYVSRVYFNNGGYLDLNIGNLKVGVTQSFVQPLNDEKCYDVTVLNIPASHPLIKEDVDINYMELLWLFLWTLPILYCLVWSFVLSRLEKRGYQVQIEPSYY